MQANRIESEMKKYEKIVIGKMMSVRLKKITITEAKIPTYLKYIESVDKPLFCSLEQKYNLVLEQLKK